MRRARGHWVVVVALSLVVAACTNDGGSDAVGRTTTTLPSRQGPCEKVDQNDLEQAVGTGADLVAAGSASCLIRRTGTHLQIDVEQLEERGATTKGLEAIQRKSGSNGNLQPWPRKELDLGDGSIWLLDPTSNGTLGELYGLENGRLIRLTVTVPLDYRRDPEKIATAVWPVLTARLAHT